MNHAAACRPKVDPRHPEVRRGVRLAPRRSRLTPRSAFTLTELLIVVAIIAVLAGLVAAAAVNAMNRGRETRITLEIKLLAQALENLKNTVGAYPPNVFPIGDPPPGLVVAVAEPKNQADLKGFLSKAAPQATEVNLNSLANSGQNNVANVSDYGLSPAEALVFWLQGFSSDGKRPLSGNDLTMTDIEDDEGNLITDVVTIDSRKPLFDFDRDRLRISRDPKTDDPRILSLYRAGGGTGNVVRILLYEYLAPGSEKPYAYFDTSRYSPYQAVAADNSPQLEFFMSDETGYICPLKRLKRNAPKATTDLRKLEYVDQRKFQIYHPGLDDAWGEEFKLAELVVGEPLDDVMLFPDGPFIGDTADTLTSFTDGSLDDAQENE